MNFSRREKFAYPAIAGFFAIVFAFLWHSQAYRVGDGAEYYALFYAWTDTLRPWMSKVSFDSYATLVEKSKIIGLVPREALQSAFPSLILGNTADFNHFWLYSLAAFVVSKLASVVGFHIGAHSSYLALHFLLMLISACIANRLYDIKGLVLFLAITISSPIIWYLDKVHTELFTYCTVFCGVMLLFQKRYLSAALFLAIASAQNPSFALIAFIPFAYRIIFLRDRFSKRELVYAISTALIVLAHPTYYFFRFGVATPQLLAGGASLGGNLSTLHIWLFDPDVGLFPNWPVGAFLVVASIASLFINRGKFETRLTSFETFFTLAFFAINLYAHASTTNINSGATPGLARYALWYIPIFFPFFYNAFPPRGSKLFNAACIFALLPLTVLNLRASDPRKNESFSTPSDFSFFIQDKLSSLYNPPVEVFAERYSGFGENIWQMDVRAIVGPDCEKYLLFPGRPNGQIITPNHCFFDSKKLAPLIPKESKEIPQFLQLPEHGLENSHVSLTPGNYPIGIGKSGNIFLGKGWGMMEDWGTWSEGPTTSLIMPCKPLARINNSFVDVTINLHPFQTQTIVISSANEKLYAGKIQKVESIRVKAPLSTCREGTLQLDFQISSPMSPLKLGNSTDSRELGIGVTSITLN